MELVAWISIALAVVCALWIAVDEVRHPQAMSVMNVVWPVTALYFSVFAVWAYYKLGRPRARDAMAHSGKAMEKGEVSASQVALGTSHCGAGCMIADVVCEFGIAAAGLTLLGSVLWAEYAIDFAAAWALGIVFQYFAIKSMGKMSVGQALLAAVKADTLSILAFQVGMYAWMALVYFKLYPGPHLTAFEPVYWLTMQAGMICGFMTSFPMNWLLIRVGLKEAM
jgi:hypothetical protein